MFAIGRDPDTLNLNLGKAGVITDERYICIYILIDKILILI